MSFRFHALAHEQFTHYFSMSPEQLRQHRAVIQIVDKKPGFPCRVSLEDANLGERVLLTHFVHLPVESPFRASHAIYVREGVSTRSFSPGEVPELFRSRQLSIRSFDANAMLIDAYSSEGCDVESVLFQALQHSRVAHVDIHFAKAGCFGARVTRA